ncbi:ankyrin, partial [Cryphonectria parasitica EP155]
MLLKAAETRHTDVVRLLIRRFKDFGQVYKDKQPLLIEAVKKEDLALISLLIEHGAKINWEDPTSTTPLMCAAKTGNLDIIRLLLASGADVNFAETSDNSPLFHAINSANLEIAKLFLAEGAD